ncbi:28 kDa heat- and acid-stable phosphoprotein [Episyrphus balteatus]|uniref:28 kDa heat- and acid-stable phosphoprotein n=1 Tax=Episyrphus balteatus TaxID=286459 RepID=UPI0024868B33|nr:28 kDa heat- and acid-stable phosphoprotein [Episyrphus balteatus]
MPKGKYVNHKGRSRHFTSPEELQRAEEEGSEKSEEESENESGSGSEEETSSEDENAKGKGVSKLIEIENPNRVRKKAIVKVTTVEEAAKPELTRREREELQKQKNRAHYQKMHEQGKTAQARADLARLAIIRQQRADAAAKRGTPPKKADDQSQPGTSKSDN